MVLLLFFNGPVSGHIVKGVPCLRLLLSLLAPYCLRALFKRLNVLELFVQQFGMRLVESREIGRQFGYTNHERPCESSIYSCL